MAAPAPARDRLLVRSAKIGLLAGLLLIWETAARWGAIDPFITSSPSRFTGSILNLISRGELWQHLSVTTFEVVCGFLGGTVLGTLIAVALWCSPFLCRVLEPYLVVLNALPKIALGPIFIVWLGAGPLAIIVIALSISLVVSILEVLNGFLSTDRDMIRLVESFGAGRLGVLCRGRAARQSADHPELFEDQCRYVVGRGDRRRIPDFPGRTRLSRRLWQPGVSA